MAILGDLEQKVMEVLWHAPGPRSVRDVHDVLTTSRDLAYTTVMTVLDRLAKKGIVARERDGRQWLYVPAHSRAALIADEILELLEGTPGERRDVLTEVVGRLDPADREFLRT
ncbi:BlaI/MecI/CopY family transcriptional regulator [Mariniluteicoccus endophyticus]